MNRKAKRIVFFTCIAKRSVHAVDKVNEGGLWRTDPQPLMSSFG